MKTVRTRRRFHAGRWCPCLTEHQLLSRKACAHGNEVYPAGRTALLSSHHRPPPDTAGQHSPRGTLPGNRPRPPSAVKQVRVGRVHTLLWCSQPDTDSDSPGPPRGPTGAESLVSWQILRDDLTLLVPHPFPEPSCRSPPNFYPCISFVSYCFTNPQSKHWICSKGDRSIFKVLSDRCKSFAWIELSPNPFLYVQSPNIYV